MTIIIKKRWNKNKVRKLVDYLYTAKASHDPMTHYMNKELNNEMLYFLLQNPNYFASYYFYQQFVEMYFPEFASEHPTYTGMFVQMAMVNDMRLRQQRRHQRMYEINYQRLLNDTRKIRNDQRINHTMQLNVDLDRILRETTIDLTLQHEQSLERTIYQLTKAIEKEGLIDVPDIKKNKKLQEKLEKYRKQIIHENKRLEKNKTNRVLWQKARLLDDKYKPTFKVWDQHPNPKTRHTLTDGQKVKLEEKFIVINDKNGDLDYVDYPGDWTCSASNSANCLCGLSFTNDPKGYREHKNLMSEYTNKSEKIKQNILIKRTQRQQEKVLKKIKKDTKKNILIKNNIYKSKFTHKDVGKIDLSIIRCDKRKINNVYLIRNNTKTFLDYPKIFKQKIKKQLDNFNKRFRRKHKEYGTAYDYITGEQLLPFEEGTSSSLKINLSKIKNLHLHKIIVTHIHPPGGPPCFSSQDITHLFKNEENFIEAVSEHEIWRAKDNNTLSKEDKKEIIEKIQEIEQEHFAAEKKIEEFTREKYNEIKKDPNYLEDWLLNRNDERKLYFQVNNEYTNKKILEILNDYGIETNRYLN